MDDERNPPTSKVRWDNDFGPNRPMWMRYLMAGAALTFVVGFMAFAIVAGQDAAEARGNTRPEPWSWPVLLGLFALVVLIAVKGEHWAIRLRHFFAGRPQPENFD